MAEFTEDDLMKVIEYVGAFDLFGDAPEAEVLRELGLFEWIRDGLVKNEVAPDDLKGDLDDIETKLTAVFDFSVMESAEAGRSPENEVTPVLSTLSSIKFLSKQLLYSAKAESMQARWAKDYYNGHYAKRTAEINNALSNGTTTGGGYNNEGGASYYVSCICVSLGCRTFPFFHQGFSRVADMAVFPSSSESSTLVPASATPGQCSPRKLTKLVPKKESPSFCTKLTTR